MHNPIKKYYLNSILIQMINKIMQWFLSTEETFHSYKFLHITVCARYAQKAKIAAR